MKYNERKMNVNYMKNQKGLLHISRIIILMICIVYMNIFSCGQNAFGGHANVNSTSDSEFIHISKYQSLFSSNVGCLSHRWFCFLMSNIRTR
jgi:ABC-type polysaccharide transport system permease subunit